MSIFDFSGSNDFGLAPGASGVRAWAHKTLGGGSAPSTTATDTYAALTRQQWQDYVKNFVPFENKLINYATDPNVVTDAMSSASQDVNGAFDRQAGATGRRLAGLGLSLNPDEQHAADRSLGLSRSLADVQAQNSTRDVTRARQMAVIGNPSPQVGAMP